MLPQHDPDKLAVLGVPAGSGDRAGKRVVLELEEQPRELAHRHLQRHAGHLFHGDLPRGEALERLVDVGHDLEVRKRLFRHERVVDGVHARRVCGPLPHHDGGHDGQNEVRVVADLRHNHRQRHGDARDSRKETRSPNQRERARVHPQHLGTVVDPQQVRHQQPKETANQGPVHQARDHDPGRAADSVGVRTNRQVHYQQAQHAEVVVLVVEAPGEQGAHDGFARRDVERR
mmetsp:Transcript_23364/g.47798  ORF Transcript_23364/g.47798 Transcript_23364/m.47798 type:complete len:231 (+) Transcript_23364:790-1482(+)